MSSTASRNQTNTNNQLYSNALGSATAGIISRLLTHPLDTAKARIQVPNSQYNGVKDVLRKTYRSEGLLPLYRGFGAIVVGGTPGTMTYLCTYEWIKTRLTQSHTNTTTIPEFAIHFGAGMIAEAIACIIYVPVDVIKERLQVQIIQNEIRSNQYNGSFDALKKIIHTEGLAGIYKGYGATLASFGPFSAFYFLFYEQLKDHSQRYSIYFDWSNGSVKYNEQYRNKKDYDNDQTDNNLPFPMVVLSSAIAGAAASWITSPLDMAKLRLQIQRSVSNTSRTSSSKYSGMINCLSHVYQQNGIPGLFRGAGARVLHFTPATMITMSCFETCRSFFSSYV